MGKHENLLPKVSVRLIKSDWVVCSPVVQSLQLEWEFDALTGLGLDLMFNLWDWEWGGYTHRWRKDLEPTIPLD